MNRRNFIKNTAILGAGVSVPLMAKEPPLPQILSSQYPIDIIVKNRDGWSTLKTVQAGAKINIRGRIHIIEARVT